MKKSILCLSVIAFIATSCKKEVIPIPEIPTCRVSEVVYESSDYPTQRHQFNYDSDGKLISTTITADSSSWTNVRHYNETVVQDFPADSLVFRTTYNDKGCIILEHRDSYKMSNDDSYHRNVYNELGLLVKSEELNASMQVTVAEEYKYTIEGGNIVKKENWVGGSLYASISYVYDLSKTDQIPIPKNEYSGWFANKNLVTKVIYFNNADYTDEIVYQFDDKGRVVKSIETSYNGESYTISRVHECK